MVELAANTAAAAAALQSQQIKCNRLERSPCNGTCPLETCCLAWRCETLEYTRSFMDDDTNDSDIFGHVLHRQVPCALRKLLNISNLRQVAKLTLLSSPF